MSRLPPLVHAFGVIACAFAAAPVRADFSFTHGGHSYLVVETARTFAAAGADAGTRQVAGATGHLAVIESLAENQAIFAQISNPVNIPIAEYPNTRAPDGGNDFFVWIGATDQVLEGTWVWDPDANAATANTQFWQGTSSGSSIGGLYHNWGGLGGPQQEPDNGAGGLQDAAGIGLDGWPRGDAGEWNDVRPDNNLYYVVEFDAVPEPIGVAPLIALCALWNRRRARWKERSCRRSQG